MLFRSGAESEQVVTEVEAAMEVVKFSAFLTSGGFRLVVPDPHPTEPALHRERSRHIALRVVEEVAERDGHTGPCTVPLDLAAPVAQITIVLCDARRQADLQIALRYRCW